MISFEFLAEKFIHSIKDYDFVYAIYDKDNRAINIIDNNTNKKIACLTDSTEDLIKLIHVGNYLRSIKGHTI